MEIKNNELKILYSEEQIKKRVNELAKELEDLYYGEEITLVCVLKGGVLFATDLAKKLDLPVKMEFIKLSSYGNETISSGKITAIDLDLPDLNNKNVLLIDDIVDSGLTAKFLVDYINANFRVKSLKFCSLLNKKVTRTVDIEPDYYCFDVDNKFVVGFGLDYAGLYRNLPYIAYKE